MPRRVVYQNISVKRILQRPLPYLGFATAEGSNVDVELFLHLGQFVFGGTHILVAHRLSYSSDVDLKVGSRVRVSREFRELDAGRLTLP